MEASDTYELNEDPKYPDTNSPEFRTSFTAVTNALQGSDGFDVQWKCEADLDSSVRFGSTDVTCEGYDYPEDPFVLKGSCGLEYGLEFVNGGGGAHQSQACHFFLPFFRTLKIFSTTYAIVTFFLPTFQ